MPESRSPDPGRPDPRNRDAGQPEPAEEPEQAPEARSGEPDDASDAVATPGEGPVEQQQRDEVPETDDSRDPLEDTVEMAAIRWDADDDATDPEETPEPSAEAVEQPDATGSAAAPEDDEPEPGEHEPDASSEDGSDDLAGVEPEQDAPAADGPAAVAPPAGKAPRTVPAADAEELPEADSEADSRDDSADDSGSGAVAVQDPAAAKDESVKPAAAARTSTPAQDRLVKALLKPSRRQVVVAVLLGLLAFAAVTQVRANEVDDSYAGLRQQDLIDTLNNLSNAERRADAEIARLQQDKEELENSTNRREAAIAQAKQLTDTLDILAGVVPVTGPGLRITIEETEQEIDIDTMIDTVQELRNAGAESMEFNDEVRVIAQTSLQQGVGGIEIDGTLLEPPYVIDVIGDPDTLESSGMRFPTGPLEQLGDDQATTTIDRSNDVEIASVVEERDPEHLEQE